MPASAPLSFFSSDSGIGRSCLSEAANSGVCLVNWESSANRLRREMPAGAPRRGAPRLRAYPRFLVASTIAAMIFGYWIWSVPRFSRPNCSPVPLNRLLSHQTHGMP